MRILMFFIAVLFLCFSLQTTAQEAASAFTEVHANKMQPVMSSTIEQAISDTFDGETASLDFQEVSEIDVDKIILPSAYYSLLTLNNSTPVYAKNIYSLVFSDWLDKPPLSS